MGIKSADGRVKKHVKRYSGERQNLCYQRIDSPLLGPSILPSAAYGDINLGGFVGTNEEYTLATVMWNYNRAIVFFSQ